MDISLLTDIPDRDLEEIVDSIKKGAKQPGDALGFGPDALNAMEQMALGFYRTQLYDKAAVIYGFILQMNVDRASAWRGMGACCQALQSLELAVECYYTASQRDREDVASRVYMGECLCQLGDKEQGLKILKEVVEKGTKDKAYLPYVTRARAVIGADGGMPSRLVLRREGKALASEAKKNIAEVAAEQIAAELPDEAQFDENREIEWDDIKKNPELAKTIAELSKRVDEGSLSYAEVGGFTDNELNGAYACACKYAEMGQVLEAIQIGGYLIFLDPHGARHYQLVGICMQRLKQYENADYYYKTAQILEPDNAMTLVYRGESKIMAGKTDEGLELVRAGIAAAGKNPDMQEIGERGEVLVRQFGS